MSQMTNFMENKLADFIRQQGLTLPSSWYLALGSVSSDSGFTELSGAGYGRQAVVRSLANFAGTQGAGTTLASNGTSHVSSNNGTLNWGTASGSWGTANCVGFFDASTGGNCWMYFPIAPLVIVASTPVSIAPGDLSFSIGLTNGCSDYLANKLIDLIFRNQAYAFPATVYMALHTLAPTSAGGGTEVATGGYARVALPLSLANVCGTQGVGTTSPSSGSEGEISNNVVIAWPVPSADWGTILAGSMRDALTAGNQLFSKLLGASKTVNAGPVGPKLSAGRMKIVIA